MNARYLIILSPALTWPQFNSGSVLTATRVTTSPLTKGGLLFARADETREKIQQIDSRTAGC